jgi:3-oxoacyl-[acyl-carrier protein] reductase
VTPAALAGRVAVVTGANHGIGAAIAGELARLGGSILVTYLRPPPSPERSGQPASYLAQRGQSGEATAGIVRSHGAHCAVVEADLTDPGTPSWLFDEAERQLGPVTILVNNASGWRQDTFSGQMIDSVDRDLETVSAETFDANFAVDARAAAVLMSEFARRHRLRGDQWGRIVSLCSGGGRGFPEEASYGAAKAALESYTMSAAAELHRQGITANVVFPPVTDTGWITDRVRWRVSEAGSVIAAPAEVAEVVGWLCSEAARRVTGNRIRMR